MQRRPLIGVTGPDKGGKMAWLMTAWALRRCGAEALRITPEQAGDETRLDGLIIGGGTDVDPFHYGEERMAKISQLLPQRKSLPRKLLDSCVGLLLTALRIIFSRPKTQDYDPDRDRLEHHLIQYAIYQDIPILGICRGAQLMNVVLGGSLHQSIDHYYTESTNIRSILPGKSISIDRSSRLYTLLEKESCDVNALHDQSINTPGKDVVVSASEANGVVQAIERPDHRFFIGVQWHPEYMPQSHTQQKLFQGLVAAAHVIQSAKQTSAKTAQQKTAQQNAVRPSPMSRTHGND